MERGFHDEFKGLKYQTTDVRSACLCNKLNCKNLIIVNMSSTPKDDIANLVIHEDINKVFDFN